MHTSVHHEVHEDHEEITHSQLTPFVLFVSFVVKSHESWPQCDEFNS